MEGIEFQEEKVSSTYQQQVKKSSFGRFLVNMGIAKDEDAANYILLAIALIFIAIAAFVIL
jgi:hypothetical protein